MHSKVLVIVDMQNDFVTGALGNSDCREAVAGVLDLLRQGFNHVYATMDTHGEDYLSTQEGIRLPVKHCIHGTEGWEIVPEIREALDRRGGYSTVIKGTFGSPLLCEILSKECAPDAEVWIAGVCTDICVVSNALMIRSMCPEMRLTVYSKGCGGTCREAHDAALTAMRSCQIDVLR